MKLKLHMFYDKLYLLQNTNMLLKSDNINIY